DAADHAALANLAAGVQSARGVRRRQLRQDQPPGPAGHGVTRGIGAIGLHPVLARDADRLVVADQWADAPIVVLRALARVARVHLDALQEAVGAGQAARIDRSADRAGEPLERAAVPEVVVPLRLGPARRAG